MKTRWFYTMLILIAPALARGQVLFTDTFDSYAVGDVPIEWTVTATNNTDVSVTNNVFVSATNSLRFLKATGAHPSYPQAIRSFPAITGGIVRVTYRARTTASNHDSLYFKLRNAAGQEVGGLRFSTTATIQYQLPNATWTNTGSNYSANVWYELQIDFDLSAFTYSARVNGNPLFAGAAFRTNTSTAASLIVQDRIFANPGIGSSFLDDVQVESLEPPVITRFELSPGGPVIEWSSQTNALYSLLYGTNVSPLDAWTTAYSNILAPGASTVFTASWPSASTVFWAVGRE